MKKITLLIFLSAIVSSAIGQVNWNNTSFVHRNGQVIEDGQNNSVQLEGVNLGGWLMWEGWIWNGGFTQQKTIFNTIESELGTTAANNFRDSIYWNYITKDDITQISDECFNVVRIPFNHYLLEDDFNPYVYKPEGWAVLDSALAWCEQNNVYAILDLHSAPGGQSNLFTADPDFLINLWNGSINQTRTANLWKVIADRYKNRGIIAGYDLLNEPDPTNDTDMLNLYRRIIDSIRTVDNNHMLFIEGSHLSSDFSVFTSLIDSNMAYEFHLYSWFITDIAAEVQKFTNLSQTYNVPVWCGEWGENSYQELDTTLQIFRNPSFGLSGSAFWTWKKAKRSNSYPNYLSADTTVLWNKTIQWIGNNTLPQPSTLEIQTGIDDFINNIKWSNCTLNDTLSDVLTFCGITGVRLNELGMESVVFPNPTNGKLKIELDQTYSEIIINVRNINGQVVSTKFFNSVNSFPLTIEGADGIYFVEIVSRDANSIIKIIKQ